MWDILFRQMLRDFVPPAWVRQIIVVADAGFAANETLRLIAKQHYAYVFATNPATTSVLPVHH
jgi:hypothetical protein